MNVQLMLRETSALTLARRDALTRPQSFNSEARTIEAIIATSAPVRRQDECGAYLEVLDVGGADLEALRGASVLNAHQAYGGLEAVIGAVDDAWREGDSLIARLRLSSRPELAALVEDIGAGVIASVSVGYEVSEWRDGEAEGQRTRTAVKWRPREVSFVPVSADPAARTRQLPESRAAVNRQIRALAERAGVSVTVANDLIDRQASMEEARGVLFDNLLVRGRTALARVRPRQIEDDLSDAPGVPQLHPDGLAGARPVDQSRGSLNWGPSEKNASIAIGAGYRNLNTHFSSPSATEL
jgi:hypothetical protein